MLIETLVGLQVDDDEGYRTYREKMMPILRRYGGEFGYDFQVSKVLRTRTINPINRVFTICFPNLESMDSFFSNDEYLHVKQRHFDQSVSSTTILAQYNHPP